MFDYLRTRLQQGTRTSDFPGAAPELPARFRGLPVLDRRFATLGPTDGAAEETADESIMVNQTPAPAPAVSGFVSHTPDGSLALDVGACLFSPEEEGVGPAGMVSFTHDIRMASRTREGLVTQTGEVELAHALDASARRLFGRSLRLRSVVAGSCNGCEAELGALGNVVFDLSRFGVQFVASPRHADGIVITGTVNANMRDALERTYAAVPDPRLVIAVGACALSGGPFRESATAGTGVPPEIPVDLWVAGCPPHPLTVLDGLLRLLGRVSEEREGRGDGQR